MTSDFKQSSALHGLGSSSSRGTKRLSDATIYDTPDTLAWKREPTRIEIAITRKPKNNVSNPFSRMSRRGSERNTGGNPTSNMTAVNQTYSKSNKRARTMAEGFKGLDVAYPNKYSGSEDQQELPLRGARAIPSIVKAGSGSTHNSTTSNYYRERDNVGSSSVNVIHVDSEPEDLGSVALRSDCHPSLEARDEVQAVGGYPDQTSRRSLFRTSETSTKSSETSRYAGAQVGEESSLSESPTMFHPSNPLNFGSRRTVRCLPEDGPSTRRLNGKLAPIGPSIEDSDGRNPSNISSKAAASVRKSPTPLPETSEVVLASSDEIEEFPEASLPPSPKRPIHRGFVSVSTNPSGKSDIPRGLASQRRMGSDVEVPYYRDLRKARTYRSRIALMRGKDKRGLVTEENSGSSVASHDKSATASTPYTQRLAFPLELLIWGSKKVELDKNDTHPHHWLYWNEGTRELQIHNHPSDPKTLSKKPPQYSIDFSILTDGKVQISDVSDFHLLRFELDDYDLDLADDVQKEGLTFKFMSKHSNMTTWGVFTSRLKALLEKKGRKAEILKGSNASGCLELALRSAAMVGRAHEEKRRGTSDPEADPIEDADLRNEIIRVKKRRQPRPRPVNGGRDQDIAKLLQPRRRSSRLSEATKQDKQGEEEKEEPPANSDEIILVYPRSGQGAVNITNSDLRRLEPFEFLNDTLIEFGLKLWINDLRETQPELADSVHVFSSFFFKKLASKSNKTPEEGHKSVRKWTTKVDLFKKKFVIVPINENIHWYLAIIYQPEHVLEPAPPKPPPRSSKRASNATASKRDPRLRRTDENEAINSPNPHIASNESDVLVDTSSTTTEGNSQAEAEVEGLVNDVEPLAKEESHSGESKITAQLSPEGNHSTNIENFLEGSSDGFSRPKSVDEHMDVDLQSNVGRSEGESAVEGKESVVNDSCSEDSDDEQVDQLADDDDDGNEPIEWSKLDLTSRMQSHASVPPQTPGISFERGFSRESDERSQSFQYPDDEVPGDLAGEDNQGLPSDGMDIDVAGDGERPTDSTVSATSFYGQPGRSNKTYADRKRATNEAALAQSDGEDEVDELDMLAHEEPEQERNDKSDDVVVTDYPRTIIFCMDSLNGTHQRALTRLSEYLQEEAKDKKGIADPSPAKTRKATMPIQPNHCDCGLYLLHFAQSFVADPEKYTAAIFSNKRSSDESRKILWNIDQVANMRERLKERILIESVEWKKQKAEKEQKELENRAASADPTNQPGQAEQSDDEIEVSEVRLVGSSPTRKPTRTQAAARLR